MTRSGAERGAGAKQTSSFTCSPASQGATLISSERTRISFERKYWAESHRVELSAQFSGGEGSTQFPMSSFFSRQQDIFQEKRSGTDFHLSHRIPCSRSGSTRAASGLIEP